MFLWNLFTPHLNAVIVFIAGPVTLLVAIWGMTGERAIKLMGSRGSSVEGERMRSVVVIERP